MNKKKESMSYNQFNPIIKEIAQLADIKAGREGVASQVATMCKERRVDVRTLLESLRLESNIDNLN